MFFYFLLILINIIPLEGELRSNALVTVLFGEKYPFLHKFEGVFYAATSTQTCN